MRSAAWRTGSGSAAIATATSASANSGPSPFWRAAEVCTAAVSATAAAVAGSDGGTGAATFVTAGGCTVACSVAAL